MKISTAEERQKFIDDWNYMVATVAAFSLKYDLPKPEMVYPLVVHSLMSSVSETRLLPPVIWQGVRIRFGRFEHTESLRSV